LNLDNKKLFCGIDASFSGTGLVVIDNEFKIVDQKLISTKKKDDDYDIEKRMIFIVEELSLFLTKYFIDLKFTMIEGISYGSTGDGAAQLAALNYFIRIFLFENKVNYSEVTPSRLKKFVSGKGQSKKEMMLKEVYKRWGEDFDDNNLCDSYCLARYAHDTFFKKNNLLKLKEVK